MIEKVSMIDVLKEIDCPVDKFENKVKQTLADYNHVGVEDVTVERDRSLDQGKLKGYRAALMGERSQVVVMVNDGIDHYVSTVEDVYVM